MCYTVANLMLIIGHRGAAGHALENTMQSLQAGADLLVDALEFDIRLTKDRVPVLLHDSTLQRTHGHKQAIAELTLDELRSNPDFDSVPTLQQVLDTFWGNTFLWLELKSQDSAKVVLQILKEQYITEPSDYNQFIISSFKIRELRYLRKYDAHIHLALLHNRNPFSFIAYYRQLQLSALGFNRLYIHPLALSLAKKLGLFSYVYTVNHRASARRMQHAGIDGIVTNYPEKFTIEPYRNDNEWQSP